MKELTDKITRRLLVERYLQGETTLEDERLLAESLAHADDALSEDEQAVRILLTAMPQMAPQPPSEEKSKAFDRLAGTRRLSSILLWTASTAAALVVMFLLWHDGPAHHSAEPKVIAQKEASAPKQGTPANSSSEVCKVSPQLRLRDSKNVPPTSSKAGKKNYGRQEKAPTSKPRRENETSTFEELGENLMAAVNFDFDQIDSYQLRPVGDATIVTKTTADGIKSTYIVAAMDDIGGYRLIPIGN